MENILVLGQMFKSFSDLYLELNKTKVSNVKVLRETTCCYLHEFHNTVHVNGGKTTATGVFHMTEPLVIDKYCIPLSISVSLFYIWSN